MPVKFPRVAAALFTLAIATAANAQTQPASAPATPPPPLAPAKEVSAMIAPYIDEYTLAVVHGDAAYVQLDEIEGAVTKVFDDAKIPEQDMLRTGEPAVKMAVAMFMSRIRTIGVRHVFVTFDYHEERWGPPIQAPTLFFPMESHEKADQLVKFFQATFGDRTPAFILNDKTVAVPARLTEQDLKDIKPKPRPDIENGFAATEGPLQMVIAFSSDTRDAISSSAGTLPDDLGGGTLDANTKGLEYLSIYATLPPKLTLGARIHADSPENAAKLKDFVVKLLDKGHAELAKSRERIPPEFAARAKPSMDLVDAMLTELVPKLEGADLVLNFDQNKIENFFTTMFIPMVMAETHRESRPAQIVRPPAPQQ